MGTSQREMVKEGTQEQKKKLAVAWEREGARRGAGTQERDDRAPRAWDSPHLLLSALPGALILSPSLLPSSSVTPVVWLASS